MTDKEIKGLLRDIAEDIRRNLSTKADEIDVLLNLAAVVEHMDPDTLRSRESKPELSVEVEKVVHILTGGKTLCGMKGSPKDWPAGHSWIPPVLVNLKSAKDEATCPECRRKMEKK